MKRSTLIVAAVLLAVTARIASAAAGYVVIVNKSSAIAKLKRREVAQIFLKKTSKVGNAEVVPVDLLQGSAVRAEFTKAVLEKSISAVNAYWQQQIFSGKSVPPSEMSEDDAVAFVRANSGAISYVSPQKVAAGVKVVEVSD
jgi:ABC-type phosphate transport system substrate-binding protein